MSNALRRTIRSLRPELFSPRFKSSFEAARCRDDALAGHHTISSVLAVLRDDRSNTYPERNALTRALVFEQQRAPSPFWSSALITAYYPMLSRLRHRIYGDSISSCDLDQIVIATFLSVVADFPLGDKQDRVAMHLRQRTQRRVFQILRNDQRYQDVVLPADQAELDLGGIGEWPVTASSGHRGPRNAKDAAAAVALLVEHGGDILDGECFDVVTATSICGRRIAEYLQRVAPELERDDRSREYQRIKRRHSRAIARLRLVLDPLRCPRGKEDLLCQCRQGHDPKEED